MAWSLILSLAVATSRWPMAAGAQSHFRSLDGLFRHVAVRTAGLPDNAVIGVRLVGTKI
jgi:hypothetical protein